MARINELYEKIAHQYRRPDGRRRAALAPPLGGQPERPRHQAAPAERRALPGHQRADPVGRRHRRRLRIPLLDDLPPGAVHRRPGAPGGARHPHRVRQDREEARARRGVRRGGRGHHPGAPRLRGVQRRPDRRPAREVRPRGPRRQPRRAGRRLPGVDRFAWGSRSATAASAPTTRRTRTASRCRRSRRSSPRRRSFRPCCTRRRTRPATANRLDRLRGRLDEKARAREELVAELGSAFLCADLGIASSPRADHASYIASWLELLTDEPRAVFDAATQAQQAVEFLHALHDRRTPEPSAA